MGTRICSGYGKDELNEEKKTPENVAMIIKENISQHYDDYNKTSDDGVEESQRNKSKFLNSINNQNLYSVYPNDYDLKNLKSSIFDNEDLQELEEANKYKRKFDQEISTSQFMKSSDENRSKSINNYDKLKEEERIMRNAKGNLNDYFSDEFKVNIADIGNSNNNHNKGSNINSKNIQNKQKLDFTFKNSMVSEGNNGYQNYGNSNNFNNNYTPIIYNKFFNNDFVKSKFLNFLTQNQDTLQSTRNKQKTKDDNSYIYEIIKKIYLRNQIRKIEDNFLNFIQRKEKNLSLKNLKATKVLKDNSSPFGMKCYNNGGVYVGSILNDKCNGWGKYSSKRGDLIMGFFTDDYLNDYSMILRADGNSFEGTLKNNTYSGIGIEVFNDNSKYFGELENGEKNGVGSYIWSTGAFYQGQWKNGSPWGYGTFKDIEREREYEGEWKDGKMCGVGLLKHLDGRKYFGFFLDNHRSGFGVYMWKNPFKLYLGFWKRGKQHGLGKIFSSFKQKTYVWKGGKRVKEVKNEEKLMGNLWENKGKIEGLVGELEEGEVEMYERWKNFFEMSMEEIIDYMVNLG